MVVEQEDFNNHHDNETTTNKAEENYMESGGRRITAKELLTNPNEKSSLWKKLGMAVIALLVDTGVPLAFYFILRLVIDPMLAMLISGIPALLICIIKIIWKRQLSVMALIIFFGFVLGASVALATDDPRLLLLEKSLMMGVVGFLHLVSLCPIPLYSVKINRKKSYKEFITFTKMGKLKPFLFYNMLQLYPLEDMNPDYTNGEKVGMYQWLWDNIRVFRVHLYIITAVVGLSLAGEFIIKCFMIYSSLSIDDVMVYSNIIFIIIMILTIVFCVIYVFLAKRGFYRHVDEWIANNYETKGNNTEEKRETPPAATYLLFNKVEDDKYDPLL